MPRPKKLPNRREIQSDDEFDALVDWWAKGTGIATYAEAVRDMVRFAGDVKRKALAKQGTAKAIGDTETPAEAG